MATTGSQDKLRMILTPGIAQPQARDENKPDQGSRNALPELPQVSPGKQIGPKAGEDAVAIHDGFRLAGQESEP